MHSKSDTPVYIDGLGWEPLKPFPFIGPLGVILDLKKY